MSVSALYQAAVAQGRFEADSAQNQVIARLDALAAQMDGYGLPGEAGLLGRLFSRKTVPPRGFYLWGQVGRGKTTLMDLFYHAVNVPRKRRVHFHAFMADVHARVHEWRRLHRDGKVKGDDPVVPVAKALAAQAALLCFDEFIVNDIADAMILGRLFEAMFARGVVVVATSNVAPQELYRDGLNRALFLPFIALLEQRMETIRLDARTDFRLEKLAGARVYHMPVDAAARAALDRTFAALSGAEQPAPRTLTVLGHEIPVPQAAGGVARFSFAELCRAPLGAADFLEIAQQFDALVIDGIEVMDPSERNVVRRFITLIDALYDHAVKLVASAEAPPTALYLNGFGREAVEFERTISRLIEMQSQHYMALPHGRKEDEHGKGMAET